jgi:oxygen-independent coproporphyrinogen-3 oxidase
VEQQWALNFADYFAEDLKLLAPLAKDGLVDVDEGDSGYAEGAPVDP